MADFKRVLIGFGIIISAPIWIPIGFCLWIAVLLIIACHEVGKDFVK